MQPTTATANGTVALMSLKTTATTKSAMTLTAVASPMSVRKEIKMENILCPVFDETCPYCDEEGYCRMEEDEGFLPYEECDVFYEDEEEES